MPDHLDADTIEAALQRASDDGVKFVNLQFTDIPGQVKSITRPVEQLEDSLTYGTWFDGSSIEGFARIAESDMFLVPDPTTYALVPWEQQHGQVARMLCYEYQPNGEPLEISPRWALKRAMDHAAALGFTFNTGPELEFFLFKRDGGRVSPEPHDEGGYFDYSSDAATDVRNVMIEALRAFGIVVETSHHEVARGQHEIDFKHGDALTTADSAVTFKYALKAVARQYDLYATFMPKPIFGINGSGMHTHLSLFTQDGKNAFYDATDPIGLSKTAKRFIAGQLAHACEICSVVSPLVNSYKRLVPGYEAPVYVGWGRRNRSALIRIPQINPTKPEAARIELRCPDPSCNPYLAFAVMLRAGLDGVENELELPPEATGSFYDLEERTSSEAEIETLPTSLGRAIAATEKSEVVRKALGDKLFERFLESRRHEWQDYKRHVTDWEVSRYLPLY